MFQVKTFNLRCEEDIDASVDLDASTFVELSGTNSLNLQTYILLGIQEIHSEEVVSGREEHDSEQSHHWKELLLQSVPRFLRQEDQQR